MSFSDFEYAGNQYFFGMKAHIGAGAESGLVQHVHGTAANVADVTEVAQLLHGDVFGGLRREREAALADYQASKAGAAATRLAVAAQTADIYIITAGYKLASPLHVGRYRRKKNCWRPYTRCTTRDW